MSTTLQICEPPEDVPVLHDSWCISDILLFPYFKWTQSTVLHLLKWSINCYTSQSPFQFNYLCIWIPIYHICDTIIVTYFRQQFATVQCWFTIHVGPVLFFTSTKNVKQLYTYFLRQSILDRQWVQPCDGGQIGWALPVSLHQREGGPPQRHCSRCSQSVSVINGSNVTHSVWFSTKHNGNG